MRSVKASVIALPWILLLSSPSGLALGLNKTPDYFCCPWQISAYLWSDPVTPDQSHSRQEHHRYTRHGSTNTLLTRVTFAPVWTPVIYFDSIMSGEMLWPFSLCLPGFDRSVVANVDSKWLKLNSGAYMIAVIQKGDRLRGYHARASLKFIDWLNVLRLCPQHSS